MADTRAEWAFVADIASVHRDRNTEIRISLYEARKGYAACIRKYERSRHHDGMVAAGFTLMVPIEKIGDLMVGLDRTRTAASALRGAA
ncbi:hypothetical protein ACFZ8E_06255 [Methylobacterium sp. HMF5984]|uniref:hypothetical protein n=1 Tax=Methylobacterium sp. HMF5984 TaxID=3367370 RepID=UPI0038522A16